MTQFQLRYGTVLAAKNFMLRISINYETSERVCRSRIHSDVICNNCNATPVLVIDDECDLRTKRRSPT